MIPNHEQLGPLPLEWFNRVRTVMHRCGRRTKDGYTCRYLVQIPGEPCYWHTDAKKVTP
ncbi:hypothetical protein MGALJ_19620 [Mycobacterium gallinarum]|uniref:Uncharacterized protein n=1 Tax=Mycobacterium gallinarum TaxID=39689 RepID=A0A9W4B1D7_9MYCO|nr:hypothetical protein [Mycobacterium gallinarum]BBY92293.1 hypothetical protein MGALJ_19620 [Mycobacterium gallinarum]